MGTEEKGEGDGSWRGSVDIVHTLLNHTSHPPVELNAKNSDGDTALHHASLCGHVDVVKLLLAHPREPPLNLNASNDKGETALHQASWRGSVDILQALLNHQGHPPVDLNASDSVGWTALHFASYNGHIDIIKELLRQGATVNTRTRDGRTALMLASQDQVTSDRERKRAAESYLFSLPDIDLEGYSYESDPE